MRISVSRIAGLAAFLSLALASLPAAAQELSARWQLESEEAVVGQALGLNILVEGVDAIDPPRLSIPGISVEWRGGSPRNATSIMTVNGKTTRTDSKSFLGSWSLKARTPGSYHLDALDWSVGGKTLRLPALDWKVVEAASSPNYFLTQELSPETTVPGVEVAYALTWYLGDGAQDPEFSIPLLDDPDIELVPGSVPKPSQNDFSFSYRGTTLVGVKGSKILKGKGFTTLSVSFKVKAAKSGRYDLAGTRVTFNGVAATVKAADFFGNMVDRPEYRVMSAQAPAAALTVRELPAKGRPSPFSGLIGKLSLSWEGAKKDCQVGEPLRMRLVLGGVLNKPDLDLDYMVLSALGGGDFQVKADDSLSAVERDAAAGAPLSRGYVLRAARSGALRIPALKLNYFDPETQRYGEARTPAIDVLARASAGASSEAAGGTGPLASGAPAPARPAAPESGEGSIALNPPGILRARAEFPPWWSLGLPFAAAGALLSAIGLWMRSRARRLRIERAAWRASLTPLEAREGRKALEEGRFRLRGLVEPGGLWGERLAATGKKEVLEERAREWDIAFFSEGREGEAWAERWDGIAQEALEWK